jgi:hypothetical protein
MKISHLELEGCRQSPRAWAQRKLDAVSTGRNYGYKQALVNAISTLHKYKDPKTAINKLEALIEKHFVNENKISAIRRNLNAYIVWFKNSGVIDADSNIRLNYPSNSQWRLGGLISRLDIMPDGYRAVLLGPYREEWFEELRMPLIQLAIGEKYGRPTNEISVAVQELDGSGLKQRKFSDKSLMSAQAEFSSLGGKVLPLIPLDRQ